MLLREIFRLLLSTVAGLLGSTLLLRIYLGWLRMPRSNPLAIFCVSLTEWLVAPLRRLIPMGGRFDAASFAATLVVGVLFVLLMELVLFDGVGSWFLFVPRVVLLLVRWTLYLLSFLVLVNVVLSLVNPHAPLAPTFNALTRPVLAPLRRIIPTVGGFDLSPLVLIVAIQVGLLVLDQFGI
jgi:YggT family protein